jgi:Flp pilus assembly protein TadG
MKNNVRALKWPARQGGSILVLLAIALPAIIGLAAYALNTAYLTYNQKRLQAIVNAAALSAAQDLWDSAWSVAQCRAYNYSAKYTAGNECPGSGAGGGGGVGDYNTLPSGITLNPPTITLLTLNNYNLSYSSAFSGYNAIRITQKASVPLLLLPKTLWPSATISATATAGAGNAGGASPPINVMLVLDVSGSMSASGDCGSGKTKLQCAKLGAQALVTNLTMRANNTGLIVFPPMNSATAVSDQINCTARDVSCTDLSNYMAGDPSSRWQDNMAYKNFNTIVPLTSAAVYAPNGKLDMSHDLMKALGYSGAGSNCGLEPPRQSSCGNTTTCYCNFSAYSSSKCPGYYTGSTCYVLQSSLAQAIYQAQSVLVAKTLENKQKNAIIVLSDGALQSRAMSELTDVNTGATFASFTGSIDNGLSGNSKAAGNALCVTDVSYGELKIGQTIISTTSSNLANDTKITAFGPPSGTTPTNCTPNSSATGKKGIYTVSGNPQTITSRGMVIQSTSTLITNQCQKAVLAAVEAKQKGTTIYSIAYGTNTNTPSTSSNTNSNYASTCSTDTSTESPLNITPAQMTPCLTMKWISGVKVPDNEANNPPTSKLLYFYKDSSSSDYCTSTNSTGGLTKLFSDIYDTFGSRLLPDDAS